MPKIANQLHLTQSEKIRLDDLYYRSRGSLMELKHRVEKERFELEHLLELEPLKQSEIMKQFKKLDKARSKLAEERFRFVLEVRKILGLKRFQQLRGLFEQHQNRKNFRDRPKLSFNRQHKPNRRW